MTSSTPRMALTSTRNGEEREAANDPPGEAEPPVAREITRRTSVPTRPLPWKGLTVALALLLVGGGVGAAAFLLPPEPEPVEPPPARPILPVKKAAQTPPPAPAPADGAPSAAAPEAAPAGDPGPMDASSPDSLLAPLTASSSATASAPGKRPVSRKRTSSRNPSVLQREWARTRAAYKALTRVYACENLDLLCSRYENLEAEVEEEGLGEAESAELLGKVRAMQREIQRRKKGS